MIYELQTELITQVKTIFDKHSFPVFNQNEFENIANETGMPAIGVYYVMSEVRGNISAQQARSVSATFIIARFMLILIADSRYISPEDSSQSVFNLLDQIRVLLHGYMGVNSRPWRFDGDVPIAIRTENAICYGQRWETEIPLVGSYSTV